MNLRSTILVLSCSSVVLLGTIVWHPGAFSQPRPAPVTRAEPDPGMPRHVTATPPRTRDTNRTPATAAPMAPESAPSIDDTVEHDGEQAAPVEPRRSSEAERLAYAERVFAAQVPDVSWERTATHEVQTTLDGVRRDSVTVDDVSCRGTLCRVRFDRAPGNELQQYVRDFVDRSRWPGPTAFIRDRHEDGSVTLTMFMVRQGLELPEPAIDETLREQEKQNE